MFGISGFFKNIQNSFTKEVSLRINIKEVIKKHTGADLAIENISCKNGVIVLNKVNSAILSTVFIKKSKILSNLVDLDIKVKDIR